MSEYFLKLPGDSQPRAYSEYEVREFLGQGVIDSKTLTWKQGMEGWQPVAQVLPPMSPVWEETQDQEGKDQPEEQQYRLRYPLNGLAKLSILACFVLLPFMLWSSWIVFSNNVVNYEEIQTLIQQNMVHMPSFAVPLVFFLSILFIPSLLIQLIWLYRASANIQEFQVQGIRFTPFLSVLLSCMPVVGMVLNALVLQEIYKASKNPAEWMLQTPSRSHHSLTRQVLQMSRIRAFRQGFHRSHMQHDISGPQCCALFNRLFRQFNSLGTHLQQIRRKRPAVWRIPHFVNRSGKKIMHPGHLHLSGFYRPHDTGEKG